MADDWMTDEHKAAALEGWLSNPVAQAVSAKQQTTEEAAGNPMGLPLAAWDQVTPERRWWWGMANGFTASLVTAPPDLGGLSAAFVRPVLTDQVCGVELVDEHGAQIAWAGKHIGSFAPDTEPDLVTWLRGQIAELRDAALTALRGYPIRWERPDDEQPGASEVDGHHWLSHQDALYQCPRPDHPVGGRAIADFPQNPYAAAFAARFDPRAALAQCEAHTRILDEVVPLIDGMDDQIEGEWGSGGAGPHEESELLVKLIALTYQHCPGYQETWRPAEEDNRA